MSEEPKTEPKAPIPTSKPDPADPRWRQLKEPRPSPPPVKRYSYD